MGSLAEIRPVRSPSDHEIAIPVRPHRMEVETLTATNSVELAKRMNQVIKTAESSRRAIVRAVQARGGVFDFDVSVERGVIEAQIAFLDQIQGRATHWLDELDSERRTKISKWCGLLEYGSAVVSASASAIDLVLAGSDIARIWSGVSSGVQGVSSISGKYAGWSVGRKEEEVARLLDIKKRSIRAGLDFKEALSEYREAPPVAHALLSPKALWAGRLVYLKRVKRRSFIQGGGAAVGEVKGEMEMKGVSRVPSSPALRPRLPIPDLPYIGPTVDEWIEASQQAIGSARTIRRDAIVKKSKWLDEDGGCEAIAFGLYREIRILDEVILKAEAAYRAPHPVCGVAREKLLVKSTLVIENCAWLINWGALTSAFVWGYSPAVVSLKLVANMGQSAASYASRSLIASKLQHIKGMLKLKGLIEEAKRERESFYLTLLSYYPHFDEDEEAAMTAEAFESKMRKMLQASATEVAENPDHIAVRLLMRERDKGMNIKHLQFDSSIGGLILSHMRDYILQFPEKSLSQLLIGRDSISPHGSQGGTDSPPQIGLPLQRGE